MRNVRLAIDTDPPSFPLPSFIVGQDFSGRWLVRDEGGQIGGVFRDRHAAARFAAFESGHRAGAVRFAPLGIRIELTGPLPRGLAQGRRPPCRAACDGAGAPGAAGAPRRRPPDR